MGEARCRALTPFSNSFSNLGYCVEMGEARCRALTHFYGLPCELFTCKVMGKPLQGIDNPVSKEKQYVENRKAALLFYIPNPHAHPTSTPPVPLNPIKLKRIKTGLDLLLICRFAPVLYRFILSTIYPA